MTCEELGATATDGVCPTCDGTGVMTVDGCPQKYVADICDAINLAGHAGSGLLPVAGAILDQSAWFLACWQALEADQHKIDEERTNRSGR